MWKPYDKRKIKRKMRKIKFMPPDYLLIFIMFEILLHFIFPIKKIIFYPYTYFGWLFILFGAYLSIEVWRIFRKVKTTIKPHKIPNKLITTGIFRISRNPNYLGMIFILFGLAIYLGSITPFIFPAIFIFLINKFTIPLEEKIIEKKFGKKYFEYKKKTRKWI
jgi:protein-S-isoprenylcysteine O-methyltransferase Ste14